MSRARLAWQCRRGMRELDLPLLRYLDRDYDRAAAAEQAAFLRLLEESDDALWRYFYAGADPADPVLADLVRKLRDALAPRP